MTSRKILFFGGDAFSLPSLVSLYHSTLKHSVTLVSTSPVLLTYAKNNDIQFDTPKSPTRYIPDQAYDLGVVVSYGHFIPSRLIHSFKLGAINLHPSLLPRYRGSNPIMHSLLSGDTESGVSIITLDPKRFDSGLILTQKKIAYTEPYPEYKEVYSFFAREGADLLVDCVEKFETMLLNSKVQEEALVTRAPKVAVKDAVLDFVNWDSTRIFRHFRAIGGKIPVWSYFRDRKVQFLKMSLEDEGYTGSTLEPPGSITFDKTRNRLILHCKNGSVAVHKLQVQDKPKPVDATNFQNGYEIRVSDRLSVNSKNK